MASRRASALEMVFTVTVVCAVAASGLALTYSATKDRIAEQDQLSREKALKAALSAGEQFEPLAPEAIKRAQKAAGETPVYGVYRASGSGGDVGWGIELGPRGYSGPIRMVVGLDRNGKVVGVSIVSMKETPGLGTQIAEDPAFLKQFPGVSSKDAESDLKKLDMITGATKSSRGVRHGVEAATAVYLELVESGLVTK